MWYVIVEVAGSKHYQYVKVMTLDEIQHVVLTDDLLLDARTQMVVDKLRCNAFDRLFTGRIDFCENDFVQQTQRISEFFVEVTGTGIEMRLEDGCNLTVLI